jgi:hypothetical protein
MKDIHFMNRQGLDIFSKELQVHRKKIRLIKEEIKAIRFYNGMQEMKRKLQRPAQELFDGRTRRQEGVTDRVLIQKGEHFISI